MMRFILTILLALVATTVYAADLPAQQTPVKTNPCPANSATLCNGVYGEVEVGATSTGTSDSVALSSGGSGLLGAGLGYKHWMNNWLVDGDVSCDYDGTMGPAAALCSETVRFGGNLIGLFSGVPSPAQGPMTTSFSNFTPYVLGSVAERTVPGGWAVAYGTGAGVEGPLGGAWTWRAEYKYYNYNGSGGLNTEQVGLVSVNYHFTFK